MSAPFRSISSTSESSNASSMPATSLARASPIPDLSPSSPAEATATQAASIIAPHMHSTALDRVKDIMRPSWRAMQSLPSWETASSSSSASPSRTVSGHISLIGGLSMTSLPVSCPSE